MALAIDESAYDDGRTVVLRLLGPLDAVTTVDLDPVLMRHAENPAVERLILDAAGVTHIASAGLRSLLKAVKAMLPRGAGLHGAGISPSVMNVLGMTGFTQFITTAATVEECLPPAAE